MPFDFTSRRKRMTMQRAVALAGLLALSVVKVPSAEAAAGSVPTFDTRPACADAAADISPTRTAGRCQESEQQARDSLTTQWGSFSKTDEANCAAETQIGGFPSYVQLLTCLEMARDARTLKVD
jgi:hypothetical protein